MSENFCKNVDPKKILGTRIPGSDTFSPSAVMLGRALLEL
jgi:hypothetical protein